MKWEYYQENNLESKDLDELGDEGWELVSVTEHGRNILYTFKKEKKDE